jgi:hypothetical protein
MYGRETRGKEKDESAYSTTPSEGFAAIYSMAGLDYVDWAHHGTYVLTAIPSLVQVRNCEVLLCLFKRLSPSAV